MELLLHDYENLVYLGRYFMSMSLVQLTRGGNLAKLDPESSELR